MFDGLTFSCGPGTPRRGFLPRAMLPFLRAQGSEATVRGLAVLFASESIEAARWVAVNHPGRCSAELWYPPPPADHPDTPPARATATMELLSEACSRFNAITGQDALALAHSAILEYLGNTHSQLAAAIIRPLSALQIAVDAMLMPSIEEHPKPTAADKQGLAEALVDEIESDPRCTGIKAALRALLEAARSDAKGSGPEVAAAVRGVQRVFDQALSLGVEPDTLAIMAGSWSNVTPGAPTFTFTFNPPRSPAPPLP